VAPAEKPVKVEKRKKERPKIKHERPQEKDKEKHTELGKNVIIEASEPEDSSSPNGSFFNLLSSHRLKRKIQRVAIKEKLKAMGVNLPNSFFQKKSEENLNKRTFRGGQGATTTAAIDPYNFSNDKLRERYLKIRDKLAGKSQDGKGGKEDQVQKMMEQEKEKIALSELIGTGDSDEEEEVVPPTASVEAPKPAEAQVKPADIVEAPRKETFESDVMAPPKIMKPQKPKHSASPRKPPPKPAPQRPAPRHKFPEVVRVPAENTFQADAPEPPVAKRKKMVEHAPVSHTLQSTLSDTSSDEADDEEGGALPKEPFVEDSVEQAAVATWDLFRKLGSNDPLQRMTELFWFPGLGVMCCLYSLPVTPY
jgi:hypothetical protein